MATSAPVIKSQEADELAAALEGLNGDKSDKGEGDKGGEKGEETKTEEEIAAEAAEAAMAERLKPVEKEDGSMETDGEAKARVEAEDAAAAEPTEVEKLIGEVKDLRQMLRTSKRDQVQMQAKMARLEKRPGKAAKEEEEEEVDEDGKPIEKKPPEEEPLSRVEELQGAIGQIGKERGASLDILLATMESSGAYKDVQEVCSRGNFDDIFEAIASEASKDTGKDFDEVLLEVELNVWAKDNPYKYMYDLIKKYHPSYAESGTAKPGEKGKKPPVVADAPGSIADKGGTGNEKAGWTKKRIDEMPEDELTTVPEDVYNKYLMGDLK